MKISMHVMAVDSFAPMLRSLSALLDKGAAHAAREGVDLVNARLAPDMFPLSRQVQLASDFAKSAVSRLAGKEPPRFADEEATFEQLKQRIEKTLAVVNGADPASFEGAEERECAIPIPNSDKIVVMNGLQYLRAWALPQFYFHVVTAYDILRHNGVPIGKQDYLSQAAEFIRTRA